jgi:ribosomal protein S28E/S33
MAKPKKMAKRKKRVFSATKEVRAIARERVGPVKAGVVIVPRSERKPKYKEDPLREG